jgi:hypothetical protein
MTAGARELHGLGQSARRCCLVTDAGAGPAPIARRRTLAGRPTRESALAGVQYARSRIAPLLARGSSGGRAAAPDDDPGTGPSVGRRRRHQTDCAHRAGRWTRSPSSAGRSTSPRSRLATRFGMRRWDRPRGPRQVPRRAQTRLCGAVARRRFSLAVRGRGCGGHRSQLLVAEVRTAARRAPERCFESRLISRPARNPTTVTSSPVTTSRR